MHLDASLAGTGLGVGFLVGLTGMGGGALMTPLLVLVFGVPPIAAVSSDLVTSLVMKPVGAAVHLRRSSVSWPLVRWLVTGSVPAAFAGVLLLRLLGHGAAAQQHVKQLIGLVLLVAVAATLLKQAVRRGRDLTLSELTVRRSLTCAVGAVGGLAVGMTSVGAGSVVIALLLLLYPRLQARQLVGTDLVQAIPLVAAAALGHMLFGEVRLPVTLALLLGSLPGVYLGARVSARAPHAVVRPVVVGVLTASALALLRVPTGPLLALTVVVAVAAVLVRTVRRAPEVGVAAAAE